MTGLCAKRAVPAANPMLMPPSGSPVVCSVKGLRAVDIVRVAGERGKGEGQNQGQTV